MENCCKKLLILKEIVMVYGFEVNSKLFYNFIILLDR